MLYIVCALKPEAQAFVEKYKLIKDKIDGYTIFTNNDITVAVSGIGIISSKKAVETVLNVFDVTNSDIIINVGICGANNNHSIGELIEIGSIEYNNDIFIFNKKVGSSIRCLNHEVSDNKYAIVDMESYGFYTALSDKVEKFYIFKVVSDHFEPQTVTKDGTKLLIYNKIDEIIDRIENA